MSKVLITRSKLDNLAVAVAVKSHASLPLTIAQMQTAVEGIQPNLQAKTNIAPTTSSQTITTDSGYDGLSSVQINAMPSGTTGTPTATKGTVSNHSVTVTPSVTNTTGYITGSTKTGTGVTVSASELVSGTKSIVENGTDIDVTNYASVDVAVQGGGSYSLTNIVPSQTISTTTSNLYGYVGLIPTYTAYVQSGEWYLVTYDNDEYVVTGYYGANNEILIGDYQLITSNVEWLETPFMVEHNLNNDYFFLGSRVSGNHTLKVDKITFLDDGVTLINKSITANGTYNASSDNADGYSSVTVNVSGGGSVSYDTKTATGANYQTSMEFTSMKGEPKAFVCRLNAQVSSSGSTTYYYIVDVSAYGTTTHGNCFRIGSTRRVENITSGYSWSYSGTTLTISSSAASRSASPGAFYNGSYELMYVY